MATDDDEHDDDYHDVYEDDVHDLINRSAHPRDKSFFEDQRVQSQREGTTE